MARKPRRQTPTVKVGPHSVPLPVVNQQPLERADAARNRQRVLQAAHRLVNEHGVAKLSMDQVAAAAGVGVGTLYRRFGNVAALTYALMDERERAFQCAFMEGPPPLGPSAPPAQRLTAFLHAFVDYLEADTDLLLHSETAEQMARYRFGFYHVYHVHVSMLLRQCMPEADIDYLADALLAPLTAELYVHQRKLRNMSVERIKRGLDDLLQRLLSTRAGNLRNGG